MAMSWDAGGDFAQVADGVEPATLRRRSGDSVTLAAARRQSHGEREAEPSGGAAVQADATWRVQLPAGAAAPALGDVIVDAAGQRWTILALSELRRLGQWQCDTRELRVAHGYRDRVDVQRAVWEDLGSGLEITGWVYAFTATPVCIQPAELAASDAAAPASGQARFTVIFGEPTPLEPDDRLVTEDGATYRLERFEQADRIDALPLATVVRE